MIRIDYKKLVSNFRKQGNEVKETTRLKSVLPTEPQTKTAEDIASDERIKAKVREIMDGTPAKQSLEEKARASQVGYNATSRFIIRDNNKPLLATGCPNSKVSEQIEKDNLQLMSHGKRPYTTYEAWVSAAGDNSYDLIGSPDVTWKKYTPPDPKAVSTAPAFIVKYEYYVLYENGVCYYLADDMALPSILRRCASESVSGQTQHNESVLISVSNGIKYRNLTRQEYDSIVLSQPSKEDLFKLYIQFCNEDKLLMDTSKAVPAWSTKD